MRNTELICAKNEGIEEGKQEGKQEGIQETLITSIKRMKSKALDDNTICDFLNINLDEMKNLLN